MIAPMSNIRLRLIYSLGLVLSALALLSWAKEPQAARTDATQARVEYNRDIRPIVSNNCFKCHGLDDKARRAGLRLDVREQALRPTELGGTAIVPGKSAESELVKRIFSSDANFVMPPPSSNKKLTADEKELLKNWIEQGAEYQPHWSFIPPKRPPLPTV